MMITRPVVEQHLVIEGEYGQPYKSIVTIVWLSQTRVFLSGFHGRMARREYQGFYQGLQARGVRWVHRERHGEFETRDLSIKEEQTH